MGDADDGNPQGIDLGDCATLLGQPRPLLWLRWKSGKFASSANAHDGQPIWREDDLYHWAVSSRSISIRRIPIRYWPDAVHPATYCGAREIEDAVSLPGNPARQQ